MGPRLVVRYLVWSLTRVNADAPPRPNAEPERIGGETMPEIEARPEHYIDVPEAVGVFDSWTTLQAAMYDLLIAGFSRFDISMLANEDAVREKLGDRFWSSKGLEDNPDVPRSAFVSEETIGELEGGIAGGFLFLGSAIAMAALLTPAATAAASIAAAVIGGAPGAVLGGPLARRVGVKHKDYYQHQIERGHPALGAVLQRGKRTAGDADHGGPLRPRRSPAPLERDLSTTERTQQRTDPEIADLAPC